MDDIKLLYSKDWRNPADFPAVETDEAKVREDMQLLYNEIQTFVNNTLIPAMVKLETPGIERLPTEDEVTGSPDKIPTSLAVSRFFASSGNLPTGGTDGQFLVKTGDSYGLAQWQTYKIPQQLSDLTATDEKGEAVNAQTLMRDVADKARSHYAEVIASGTIGFGDTQYPPAVTISLGDDVSEFERYFIVLAANPEGSSTRQGAVYLGRWNGRWDSTLASSGSYEYTPDTTGMLHLADTDTYGFQTETHGDLTIYLFRDDPTNHAVVIYEQDRKLAGPYIPDVGPNIYEVGSNKDGYTGGVNEINTITLFARNRRSDATNDGTRVTPYTVYGIRRGSKEG